MLTLIILVALSPFLIGIAGWLGFKLGRADIVNRLIEAKDPEGWQWAHYLRADLKAKDSLTK
jgi:hypothetical protein